MNATSPHWFGLPPREKLASYAIWDSYFLPAGVGADASAQLRDIERLLPTIEKAAIQKLCIFQHVGLGTASPAAEQRIRNNPRIVLAPLERWPQRLVGMIQLNGHNVAGSLSALDRWVRDGPMTGVYFPGGGPAALTCTHPNFLRILKRIGQLGGVVMQHTWFKTGGKQGSGESTPAELAEVAAKFPDQIFLCAHAGGEWERGIRAVRRQQNVWVETSGFDATSGFVDMAVRELGPERIVFGSHLPSRSLGTELSKVFEADVKEADRKLILGGNLRRLLAE